MAKGAPVCAHGACLCPRRARVRMLCATSLHFVPRCDGVLIASTTPTLFHHMHCSKHSAPTSRRNSRALRSHTTGRPRTACSTTRWRRRARRRSWACRTHTWLLTCRWVEGGSAEDGSADDGSADDGSANAHMKSCLSKANEVSWGMHAPVCVCTNALTGVLLG